MSVYFSIVDTENFVLENLDQVMQDNVQEVVSANGKHDIAPCPTGGTH